jgi:hypothetical protein
LTPHRLRKFAPLSLTHPAIGRACPFCDGPLLAGDETCLIPWEPSEPNSLNWVAKPAHWRCAVEAQRRGLLQVLGLELEGVQGEGGATS